MGLTFEPYSPWHWAVLAAAALTVLTVLGGLARDRRHGSARSAGVRAAFVGALVAAAASLALAALNPVWTPAPEPSGIRLAVVIDGSASMRRIGDGQPETQTKEWTGTLVQALDPNVVRLGDATVVATAAGSNLVWERLPLQQLPVRIGELSATDFPPPEETDLEAGLRRAGEALRKSGKAGAVVLISDGHETRGDVLAAAGELAVRGIPVQVLPLGAAAAAAGFAAVDLPSMVERGATTYLRALVANPTGNPVVATLRLRIDGEESPAADTLTTIPGGGQARLRRPIRFDRCGIHEVEARLVVAGAPAERRRFFTQVWDRPRILAIGPDPGWRQVLPRDHYRLEVVAADASKKDLEPADYDVVLINGVPAATLGDARLAQLAAAAQHGTTGLLLIEGPPRADPGQATLLRGYDDTPLAPLLPVTSKPRPKPDEPPPRHIVLVLDASGSMGGWKLDKSRDIARAILTRLGPRDRVDLLVFTTAAEHPVADLAMTAAGKDQARAALDNIISDGGTDPTEALNLLRQQRFRNCGLFFFSDGYFERVTMRPDCAATVFAIAHTANSIPDVLRELAEPIPVDQYFDPQAVSLSYFSPKVRSHFYEPGDYQPIPGIDAVLGGWTLLPDPPLRLTGNAIAYARDDAQLAAVRPRYLDPVLAFRDGGAGTTAVFATELPPGWIAAPQGSAAIRRWIDRLMAFSARERYLIGIRDLGATLRLRVTLLAGTGPVPSLQRLDLRLQVPERPAVSLALLPDAQVGDEFTGELPLERLDTLHLDAAGATAVMTLTESGPDALRTPQRLPIWLTPAAPATRPPGDEARSFGVNERLLREVAKRTGGRYDPTPDPGLVGGHPPVPDGHPWWPWLLVSAALWYLAGIGVQRMAP